jgi:hypothetical protein
VIVAAAAADRIAEPTPLVPEAAAGARGREELGLHEEGPHQGRPEDHESEDERQVHLASIGTNPPSDKIES